MGIPAMPYLYYVTDPEYFMHFEPQYPQYKKLKNDTITSLTLSIMDQANNIITDVPQVTVVLHTCDRKINPLSKWNKEKD